MIKQPIGNAVTPSIGDISGIGSGAGANNDILTNRAYRFTPPTQIAGQTHKYGSMLTSVKQTFGASVDQTLHSVWFRYPNGWNPLQQRYFKSGWAADERTAGWWQLGNVNGVIGIDMWIGASGTKYELATPALGNVVPHDGDWHNLLISIDTAADTLQLAIDGNVSVTHDITGASKTYANPDSAVYSFGQAGSPNNGTSNPYPAWGDFAQMAFWSGIAPDLSDPDELAKYIAIDDDGNVSPVDHGTDGGKRNGTPARFYVYGTPEQVNHGEGVSGNLGWNTDPVPYRMVGRGVDPVPEASDIFAFRKPVMLSDGDFNNGNANVATITATSGRFCEADKFSPARPTITGNATMATTDYYNNMADANIWEPSSAGADLYYYRTSSNQSPRTIKPEQVSVDLELFAETAGAASALTAKQWGWLAPSANGDGAETDPTVYIKMPSGLLPDAGLCYGHEGLNLTNFNSNPWNYPTDGSQIIDADGIEKNDSMLPLNFTFASNWMGSVVDFTIYVWHDASGEAGNYTAYHFDGGMVQEGWCNLVVVPQIRDILAANEYRERNKGLGMAARNGGTGWDYTQGIDKIFIGVNDYYGAGDGFSGRPKWLVFAGLWRGYGHTPVAMHTVDDGSNEVWDTRLGGSGANSVEYLAAMDEPIPHGAGLIAGDGYAGDPAKLATMAANGWEFNVHGAYNIVSEIQVIPGILNQAWKSAVESIKPIITQSVGNGEGRWLGWVGNDQMVVGVFTQRFTGNASDLLANGGLVIYEQTDYAMPDLAASPQTHAVYEAIDLDISTNQDFVAAVPNATSYDYIYPEGGYRNSTDESNETAGNVLADNNFRSARGTNGWPAMPSIKYTDETGATAMGDFVAEQLSIGGTTIEGGYIFETMADIIADDTGFIDAVHQAAGGVVYWYWHRPKVEGTDRNGSAIAIDDLFSYLDKIAAERDSGWLRVPAPSKYIGEHRRKISMGRLNFKTYL